MQQDTGIKSFLLVGSNLGNPHAQIDHGYDLVNQDCGRIIHRTPCQKTEPWGYHDQPVFYNEIWTIETVVEPLELLRKLKNIEVKCGRKPRSKWYARELDIDILFYGQEVVQHTNLTIPHPWHHKRLFSLKLMREAAPNFSHPIFEKTSEILIESLP
ncbi:MAG TPA: 2-amino-4-hydroxy-6-hydroxymethyldihydropteridine diphosphokinase [Bacteroidetes bacterium]|nr:2-amino-4-hydroxy-6-hydroxymethyldihydropteridine diphosphokinase [Bacteroidota bacterium]